MKCSRLIPLFLLVFAMSVSLFGDSVLLNESGKPIQILEEIKLLQTADHSLTIQNVQSQAFLNYDLWKSQIQTDKIYWGRFELENTRSAKLSETDWILEFPIVFTDITVYSFDDAGNMQESRTGQFVPIEARTFSPKIKTNLVRLNLSAGERLSIYFKAKTDRKYAVPNFDLKSYPTSYFYNNLKNQKFYQGLFIGFMLMMLIYNLFLYFFNAKDKAYLHYSIYIFGIVMYSAYNSGVLADLTSSFLIPNAPKYAYLGKTSTYIVIAGYLFFLRAFLHLEELLPKWNKMLQALIWINLFAFVMDVILMLQTDFNSDIADFVTVGNAIIFVAFIFLLCIFLYKTKDRKSYFIIAGIVLMGIGAVLTILARMRGVDYSTTPFQIGTVLEVIIFSLGLAYRRRTIERDKQQAYFELQKTELLRTQEKKEADRLKEVDKLRSRLYTNITHEFRTPLTVINGNLEFIKDFDKEKSIIKRNSDQMLRLINQVLDMSKLEANLLETNLIQSDMVAFLQYITESFHSMAKAKNIRLMFYAEEKSLMMDFDKEKMEHIIYNLISNAIKFTSSGGKIILHLKKEIEANIPVFVLKVKDTGRGIGPEQLPFIFDRFHKLNNDSNIGTGIGLAFVKELVEMLNGKISVSSEIEVGTEFNLILPIRNTASILNLPNLDQISQTEIISPTVLKDQSQNEDQPLLLLVEDNRDVSDYIEQLLKDQYDLHFAFDGAEGIEKALELVPDIIICDVIMPKKNGFQVTKYLKENQKTSHIPIILLTAKSTQADKNDGLSSGADSYLLKPFDKQELLIRLANISRQRKVLVEKIQNGFFDQSEDVNMYSPKENEFLMQIKTLLLSELNKPDFGVEEIGSHLGLNKNQFYRKLKAITGQSPTHFIRDLRLHEAQELLKNSNLNISEVAYQVGFKDPNYFTRTFQKKYGKPPSKFVI